MLKDASGSGQAPRSKRGASIALVLACIIGFLALLGFFVFNYAKIFGSQREAQTAIDAAALEAAKQASNVYLTSELGNIGLVDLPPDSSQSPPRPRIVGLNTALATARLDTLIADDLNCPTMQVLANRDVSELMNNVVPQLQKKINETLQSDTVRQAVINVYQQNADRSYRDSTGQAAQNIKITFGTFNNNDVSTNIRIPDGVDKLSSSQAANGVYKANVSIPVPGAQNIMFGAVGDHPRIVANGEFVEGIVQGFMPTAVQVSTVSNLAGPGTSNSTNVKQDLKNIATAIAGAGIVTGTSSTYCMTFPSGFPPGPPSSPALFSSAKNLVSSIVINSATGQPQFRDPQLATAFNPLPTETWFRAPENNTLPPGQVNGSAGGFNVGDSNVRMQDFPPVALAFGLYDWVRSMGLRVDRVNMVSALSYDLSNLVSSTGYNKPESFPMAWLGEQPAYADAPKPTDVQNSAWLAVDTQHPNQDPRYQAVSNMANNTEGQNNVIYTFGYEFPGVVTPKHSAATMVTQNSVKTTDGNDIAHLKDAQNAVCRTNHASDCVLQAAALAVSQLKADAASHQASIDANKASEASLQKAIAAANSANPPDTTTATKDTNQLNQLQAQDAANQAVVDKDNKAISLATLCSTNANKTKEQTYNMMKNWQALTGLGCAETDKAALKFNIASNAFTAYVQTPGNTGTDFLNVTTSSSNWSTLVGNTQKAIVAAASASDLPTGTQSNSGMYSWADADSNGKADLSSYSCSVTANGNNIKISHAPRNLKDPFMQSAYAQSVNFSILSPQAAHAIPPNNNLMFLFNIAGDYQKPQNGPAKVTITPLPMSPFMNNTTTNGQCYYYAPGIVNTTINGIQVSWSCAARDNVANGKSFNTNQHNNNAQLDKNYCSDGKYSLNLPAGFQCPTLGGEFRIGCPIPGGCAVVGPVSTSTGSPNITPCPPPPEHMG